ncbi:MAG: A/G-specific adenine glycosylase [Actinomycetota bacterium]
MERELVDGDIADLQQEVLGWVSTRLRQLPWRDTRDPWAVLVSEVMLQQTGVRRVLPKWEAFMDAFPDPSACAAAELGEVLRLWQGLGYPRRARNLHLAAGVIVSTYGGQVPGDLESLLALPGVGPYTARAVLAFAHEVDAAVVDVNVARILSRVVGRRLTAREVQRHADDLVPDGEAWLWNQAMMDLGALLCRPVPRCQECPVARICTWRGSGPDPSIGSAGVGSTQSPFAGSDRQARGRLLKALGEGAVAMSKVGEVMDRPQETAERLATNLIDEGLIQRRGDRLTL